MALLHSPKIITDGLMLCLDAGNTKSYPGTGTTWIDYGGNNVTLTNGPTFNNSNLGNIVFDGVNDYVNFFVPNLSSTATVEMWCNISSTEERMFFGWYRYDVYCKGGNIGYNTANGDIRGLSATTVTNLGLVGNWRQYVFEMRSDVSYTNNKIYVNAVEQTLTQVYTSELSSNRNFNSGNGRISGWRNDTLYMMPMSLSMFRVYNRALTVGEIQHNFNFYKGRFNL